MTVDLVVVSGAFRSVWEDRAVFDWEGRRVTVVSIRGLTRMKRLAGRLQDQLDLEQLGLAPEAGDDDA